MCCVLEYYLGEDAMNHFAKFKYFHLTHSCLNGFEWPDYKMVIKISWLELIVWPICKIVWPWALFNMNSLSDVEKHVCNSFGFQFTHQWFFLFLWIGPIRELALCFRIICKKPWFVTSYYSSLKDKICVDIIENVH